MKKRFLWLALVASVGVSGGLVSLSGWLAPRAAAQSQDDVESKKIVPYVPTPQEVVDRMLEQIGRAHV